MSDQETIDALAKSVNGLDASRKVGWAKSYEQEQKVDDLLRDVNIARGDARIYRKVMSYLLGYATALEEATGIERPRQESYAKYVHTAREFAEKGERKQGADDGVEAISLWKESAPANAVKRLSDEVRKSSIRKDSREQREALTELARQYHSSPAFLRVVLRAMRDAIKTGEVATQIHHGEGIRVTLRIDDLPNS